MGFFLGVSFLVIIYTVVAALMAEVNALAILPANALLALTFVKYLKDCQCNKKARTICVILLMVDLVLIIYNSVNRNLPFTNVDWANFDYFAKSALNNSNNLFEIFGNAIDLFTAVVALLYRMFGENVTIVYFYILPLSFVSAHYLYKTIRLISGDQNKSVWFSMISLIMPVNFIFALSVLREIPIQCVSIASLYYFLSYTFKKEKHGLVLAFVLAASAALMHSGMVAILVVYAYVLLQKKFLKNVKIIRVSTIVFAVILAIVISLPMFAPLLTRFSGDGGANGVVSAVSTQNKYLLDANTSYISEAPSDFGGLITSLPYRMMMFVVAPLPWQIINGGTLVAFLADAIFRYYIVYRVIKIAFNLRHYSMEDREIVETMLMAVILFDLIFCFGTTNYGQAMRHRTKMLPFELCLLSVPVKDKECLNG